MSYAIITEDHERQRDEMVALASIYPENEFSYSKDKQIKCTANVFPNFPNKLEVRFTNCCSSVASDPVALCDKIFIEYLPPISLYIQLPDTYPSQRPPHFHFSIVWLPPWEISFLCQKLDEIWEENQGSEIIFLWLDFLQNGFFDLLGIQHSLDVSFIHMVHSMPKDNTASLAALCDPRAMNKTLSTNIKQSLVSYDKKQRKLQFGKNFHDCDICFEWCTGLQCIELKNCGHIYCKTCVREHIEMKLKGYNKDISCPSVDCSREIDASDIKTLCPSWFPQYEELMLRVALDTMDDVIYCPRTFCQYPVIRDENDSAPICYKCNYCFCVYCRKAYHGNALCEIASDDFKQLVEEYKNSNRRQQKLLEKKYGKRQIQSIEKHLTMDYLQDNSKNCPGCRSYVSKITGCNKMTCRHCQAYFCWLCGQEIKLEDPYLHYNDVNSPCFKRLFQGMDVDEYNNLYLMDDVNEGYID
ncbi:E3 ubiquitin-protein ligase RNF14 [Ooceraea biroi]|uniref:RBR-type E3 ubiquitin transferase n=1 Tax=Ooceraea biroi TaxID=2015173 RepID=A0A026WSF4_OOCBI|nr:E3 ubiquitin-protein ligase RNF14 [Ooceraea biroi]